MGSGMIYLIIAAVLFVVAFISKCRFGLLGLALSAGSLLSGIWTYNAELVLAFLGVSSELLTTATISAVIILLPAGLLLFHGYAYKNSMGRVVGAALFTLLALAFLIEPLGYVLVPQGLAANLYDWIMVNRDMVIGVGLVLAVLDLFFTKPVRSPKK